jgi:hypothetical protein
LGIPSLPLDHQSHHFCIDMTKYFREGFVQYRQIYRQKITLETGDASFEKCRGLLFCFLSELGNSLIQTRVGKVTKN